MKQVVLPIFYEVDPSEVRHQTGRFGDSMTGHEERFKDNIEKVEKWRAALRKVANLSGEFCTNESESEFIHKIIQKVANILGDRALLHLPEKVVGLESRKSQVVSLLCLGQNDVDVSMVGIYGTGGAGKTTIVKGVYNLVAEQFESTSFCADVRDKTTTYGLTHIQQSIMSDMLGKNVISLHNKDCGSVVMKEWLQKKRVLLVLDDVDKLKQLQSLAGGCDWFGPGSRVIITTRDKQLLRRHGIEKMYEVKELEKEESLKLLCWNAFRSSEPEIGFEDVSMRVLSYARGIPLALEIIGSHLFGKDVEEWESAMDAYKRSMDDDIFGVLKVSYDSLGYNEREIFLDVSCFYGGYDFGYVKTILEGFGFSSKSGLSILEDRCLVKIQNERVWMHDLTQSMGREIVRRESEREPWERSRIWFHGDALQVLTRDMGTSKIQGLKLEFPQEKEVVWTGKAFGKMMNLRILIIRNAVFSKAPKELPNRLKVFEWENYPSSSLPSNFLGNGLLRLHLVTATRIVQIQEPFKKFQNITHLIIELCDALKEIPDASGVPYLRTIVLHGCRNLVKIHDSVGSLDSLTRLSIFRCPKLKKFSAWNKFKSLLQLCILSCGKLGIIPFGCMQATLQTVWVYGGSIAIQSDCRSRLLQEFMDRHFSHEYCILGLWIPRCFGYRSNKNLISFWIQKSLPDVHVCFDLKGSEQPFPGLFVRFRIGPFKVLHEVYSPYIYSTLILLLPRVLPDHHKIQEMLTRVDCWVPIDISVVRVPEYSIPESTDNEDSNASLNSNHFVKECGIYVGPTCDANFSFVNPYG